MAEKVIIYFVMQQALVREYQAEMKYLTQNKEKAAEVILFFKFVNYSEMICSYK